MKEQLISYETAVLAKEKGFDECGISFYLRSKLISDNPISNKRFRQPLEDIAEAPTQSLLQKWLRDQKVLVEVSPIDGWDSWSYNITMEDAMSPFFIAHQCNEEYETYEHALEEGLKKALDLM